MFPKLEGALIMNKLKYSLEYHCYPIWHYDGNDELIDNDLPDELRNDSELDTMLLKVQEIFDSLYLDTPKEFAFLGFQKEIDRQNFLSLLFQSVELIKERYPQKYEVECKYSMESFQL